MYARPTRYRHRNGTGTPQSLILYPLPARIVPGYALYGVWIGIAIAVAIIGLVTAMIYLSKVQ